MKARVPAGRRTQQCACGFFCRPCSARSPRAARTRSVADLAVLAELEDGRAAAAVVGDDRVLAFRVNRDVARASAAAHVLVELRQFSGLRVECERDDRPAVLAAALADRVEELAVRVDRQERRAAHLGREFRLRRVCRSWRRTSSGRFPCSVLVRCRCRSRPSIVGRRGRGSERRRAAAAVAAMRGRATSEILRFERKNSSPAGKRVDDNGYGARRETKSPPESRHAFVAVASRARVAAAVPLRAARTGAEQARRTAGST